MYRIMILLMLAASVATAQQADFSKEELIGKGSPQLFGKGFKLRKGAYEAYLNMKKDAAAEGIDITVVSSYRSFGHQKQIFERKFKQYTRNGLSPEQAINKIIEYSTIPGTSRHHWGTDIDIIDAAAHYTGDVLVPGKFHDDGPFSKLKDWMDKNSQKYGFYLVYTQNENRKGFKYEPWHYSYLPISGPMLKAYREQIDIKKMLITERITGSKYFTDAFLDKYLTENVLDVNPDLL